EVAGALPGRLGRCQEARGREFRRGAGRSAAGRLGHPRTRPEHGNCDNHHTSNERVLAHGSPCWAMRWHRRESLSTVDSTERARRLVRIALALAYPLRYRPPRSHTGTCMQIRFWGTRGSLAKPGPGTLRYGGNTSCVEVRTGSGTLIVFDCGTGAHGFGQALMGSGAPVRGHLMITHTHWDH